MITEKYFLITCDHQGCEHSVSAATKTSARRLANKLGWALSTPEDHCPEHNEEEEPAQT